ncbi:hemophilus-specific protein [Avibacterium paragallinarum]|uniref:hemophilus-specific protein n=1 Tax=Avibacterium TaxID=292486 RepID=UPI00397A1B16
MTFEKETNVLDLPNCTINFDADFAVSCGLPNSEALLVYLEPYLNKWIESQDSVHQFATKYADEGISLWTASDMVLTSEDKDKRRTCFYLVSTQNEQGYALVHCTLSHQDRLQ